MAFSVVRGMPSRAATALITPPVSRKMRFNGPVNIDAHFHEMAKTRPCERISKSCDAYITQK